MADLPSRAHRLGASLAAALATVVLSLAAASPAQAAPSCAASGPESAAYTVSVCLSAPADGATVSGEAVVNASVSVTGAGPGVRKLAFLLGDEYLLTDFEAPWSFRIPTAKWADATRRLTVHAVMRDDFESTPAGIDLTFANGPDAPVPNTAQFTPTTGTLPQAGRPFVMATVGDGVSGEESSDNVQDRIRAWDPNLFLYLGDVYEEGSLAEFHNWGGAYFQGLRGITNPVIGNHEWETGSSRGYFDFWDNIPHYYSVNANGWHIIALDSNPEFGELEPGTGQYDWLRQDLEANGSACTIAFMHAPRFNIGPIGDLTRVDALWRLLQQHGTDILLTGHDHTYQRWKPLDAGGQPDLLGGMTQLVVGTGGRFLASFARSDDRVATAFRQGGAMRMELNAEGAAYRFVSDTGVTLDSGAQQCSGTGTDTVAPDAPGGFTAVARRLTTTVDLQWTSAMDNVGVVGYDIYRNGELLTRVGPETSYSDTSVAAGSAYAYEVRAVDAADNASAPSAPATAQTDELSYLFFSGFEIGDLSRFSAIKSMVAQQQEVFTGSWGGRATSAGTSAAWAYRSVGSHTELYAQTRFKIVSQGANQANLLAFKTGSGGKLLTINRSSTGKLAIRNEVGAVSTTSGKVVTAGIWHTLQGRLRVGDPAGLAEVRFDGVKVDSLTNTATFGTTPIGRVEIGDTSTNRAFDIAFDEVAADPALIADTTDPSMNDRLSAVASTGLEVQLNWDAATDDTAVSGYEVYRNGELLATPSTVTTYMDRTVDPGTSYYYQVRARDAAGNLSHFTDLATITTPAAFDDDFESGNLSKWTIVRGLTTGTDEVSSGQWAARARSTGPVSYAYYTLPSSRSELYYRVRFKGLSQGPSSVNLLRFKQSGGTVQLSVYVTSAGKLSYRNDFAGTYRNSAKTVTLGSWHELQVRLDTQQGQVVFWLDGKQVNDLSMAENFGGLPIGRIELGESVSNRTYDFAFDDVRLDTALIPDTAKPSPPADLTATPVSADRVDLSWTAATDNVGVSEYEVFRDDRLVARVDGALTAYSDQGLDPDTEYAYEVRAADGSENESDASNRVTVTTPQGDAIPPTAPTGLAAAEASPDYVDLTWQPATDDTAIDGYKVYRDGAYVATTPAVTTYRDTSVPSPADVTYTVVAVDGSANESPASEPASVRVSYFGEGFEWGLGRWSRVAGLTIASEPGAGGQFAARATSTGTGVYGFRDLPQAPTDLYARVRFKFVQAGTSVYLTKLRDPGGAAIVGLYRSSSSSGTLTMRNSVTGSTINSTTPVTLDSWHQLDVRVHIAGAAGETEVWLDGTRVASLSRVQNLGTAGAGRYQLGDDQTQRSFDAFFDDVLLDEP
jgi:fibronectin type 3 domain-containing protein